MAKNGLDKWFAQKWVDIGSKRKMDLFQNVEDQNKKQIQNVNIQNVCHLQKQEVCQKVKDDQQFLEKDRLHKVLVVNQQM